MSAARNDESPIEHPAMDERDLRAMRAAAVHHARRVARRLRLAPRDQEDVEQEIVLALLLRRSDFDPERAGWSTFVDLVVGNMASAIAGRIVTVRSREQPLSSEHDPGVEELADFHAHSSEASVVLGLSLEQFISSLPTGHAFVTRLMIEEDGDVTEALRRSGLSSSEFFRRLREVRMRLRCIDLVRLPQACSSSVLAQSDAA